MSQLAFNSFLYDHCLRRIVAGAGDADDVRLANVERVARLAWLAHPGRFADGQLENVALEIGRRFAPSTSFDRVVFPVSRSGKRRVLHVATEVYATGGHSRVIAEWMQYDRESEHALVLTRQRGPIPTFLRASLTKTEASLEVLEPSAVVTSRAAQLRKMASTADLVVLHHHPDDTVPTVALAPDDGCPVVMFNHAHFWFSLGGSVADITVNTLPYFRALSERARFPRETALLHVPSTEGIGSRVLATVDKGAAKAALGLSPSTPVMLSIGSEHYYRPADGYDFLATVLRVLAQNPTAQLILIGPAPDCEFLPDALARSPRVRVLGRVEDPRRYYEAADVVLESFPMPSLGAVFDSVRKGAAYPVPVYGAHQNIRRIDFPVICHHVARPRDEHAYLAQVGSRLQDLAATNRVAHQIRAEIFEFDTTFGDCLRTLYQRAAALGHVVRPLPTCSANVAEDDRLMAETTQGSVAELIWEYVDSTDKAAVHLGALLRGFESPLTLLQVAMRTGRRVLGRL